MNKKQAITNDKVSLVTKRGDIWLIEFPEVEENRKPIRPCLVVSNEVQNEFDKWIMVAPLTTENIESVKRWEVYLEKTPDLKIDHPSKILFNYLRTVNKGRLKKYLGTASPEIMAKAKKAWELAFDWEI